MNTTKSIVDSDTFKSLELVASVFIVGMLLLALFMLSSQIGSIAHQSSILNVYATYCFIDYNRCIGISVCSSSTITKCR